MRVALCHPTYWPEVRRGSERLIHDLAVALAVRGHEVTVVTSHRGGPVTGSEDGFRVRRNRRLPAPPGLSGYEYHLVNVPNVIRSLRGAGFDVAHSFFPSDSWAAVRARALGGPPVVATLHGIPTREYLVARRRRLAMLLEIAREADECSVLSAAAARPFRDYLLRDPVVLPGGVAAADFDLGSDRDERPTLLCPASLGDPRKRGALLFRAFELLRQQRPDATLLVAAGADPWMSAGLAEPPPGAELLTPSGAELARLYGRAWATVLPSVEEAFGLVLIESLAAGTPVVGSRSGAVPEIVTEESVGRLFEPDDEEDLARAMAAALDLAADPATAAACRERAADYEWAKVVERYEAVYERVAG
ncbi:MAG: phosphatidyl-myo-inositol alpha-mannosyltransferase [Solirubrobacterales bacterium]|jgi:phosphatidylinositol alpha-mannosyltransferase|nr:phosphatidyl-myo-inositol alpha-mannosyltransferase [Solirubrobacterales bacterium]